MLQKGIYPYNYISSYNKLYATKLPPKKEFLSDLTCRQKGKDEIIEELWMMHYWNEIKCLGYDDKPEMIEEDKQNYIKLYRDWELDKLQDLLLSKNYFQAQRVWNYFGCETIKDYHDLYLTWDVTLLTDIFENFRTEMWNNFGLEALYYYGLPGN